jgi:hypothetical protein
LELQWVGPKMPVTEFSTKIEGLYKMESMIFGSELSLDDLLTVSCLSPTVVDIFNAGFTQLRRLALRVYTVEPSCFLSPNIFPSESTAHATMKKR